MKISIQSVESDMLLQTVSITPNRREPNNIYLFRCYHCGSSISQVQGNIASIRAGHIPTAEVVVVNQCYKCGENYTFQTVYSIANVIKLTLSPCADPLFSSFRCVICRQPLVNYIGHQDDLPFPFSCTRCEKPYLLNEVVSMIE